MAVETWQTDQVQTNKQAKNKVPKPPFTTAFMVLLSLGAGFFGGWLGANNRLENPAQDTQARQRVVSSESELINSIAKDVSASVVSIDVLTSGRQLDAFGFTRSTQQQSAGTGFIVGDKGIVITNRHVIPSRSSKVSVTLSDGTRLTDVSVIGRTSDSDPLDVAFLKINDAKGKKLKAVSLGDSSKVEVGDKVVAIGNALGQFRNTVTTGIISGHGRSVQAGDSSGSQTEVLQDLFQTDAAINQGNSGGPLVDISGDVIGINTAIAGNAQNIGFSIPINDIKGLIDSVLEKGKLVRPYLGVLYVSLNDNDAARYSLSTKRGAYIVPDQNGQPSVVPDSAADKAGVKAGDIITKVNNDKIDEKNSLTSLISKYTVGDTISLTIIRDEQTLTLKATLTSAPTG